jgi:hypothetical protein
MVFRGQNSVPKGHKEAEFKDKGQAANKEKAAHRATFPDH